MRIVSQSVELLEHDNNPLKHIERCARVCYKSEDKITDESAKKMIPALRKAGHSSTFEHFIVVVELPYGIFSELAKSAWADEYTSRYLKFKMIGDKYYIGANMRAWLQVSKYPYYCDICSEIAYQYNCKELFGDLPPRQRIYHIEIIEYDRLPEEFKWHTFKIITDRCTTQSIERHRKFGYSQESTRYCNYGDHVTFNEPVCIDACEQVQKYYYKLVSDGMHQEYARGVLPMDVNSEMVMTGYDEDFDWFIKVRGHGKYGKPHEKVRRIALEMERLLR